MIEHDCSTAAQQAGYPVGEEDDADPPALEQGTGRDLTCLPDPGATATPRGVNRADVWSYGGLRPASALARRPRHDDQGWVVLSYLRGLTRRRSRPDTS